MLCEKCGKNTANTYIKTVIDGKVTEMHLCPQCAAENYKTINSSFEDMLSGLFGSSPEKATDRFSRCPCCGASLAEISRSGKMGCAQCYSTFREQLLPSIKRIHGKTKHVGKVPPNAPAEMRNAARISELKEQLQDAVRNEDFEKAAQLRDSIRQMEGEESK